MRTFLEGQMPQGYSIEVYNHTARILRPGAAEHGMNEVGVADLKEASEEVQPAVLPGVQD
jgi:hypothetical protein